MNDEYPVDAPKFDAVSQSQYNKVKSQFQDNNEDSLYLNQYDIVMRDPQYNTTLETSEII